MAMKLVELGAVAISWASMKGNLAEETHDLKAATNVMLSQLQCAKVGW